MIDLWDKRRNDIEVKTAERKLSIQFFQRRLADGHIAFHGKWYKLNAREMRTSYHQPKGDSK